MGREMNELAWHIEWRDPAELIPYDRNAKLHDGRNIANIAASIRNSGWQSCLVITRSGIVIIGHGRRLAAMELGCRCPCKVIEDDLTEEEIQALRIADNLTHDDAYDWATLEEDFKRLELNLTGFDFDLRPPAEEPEAGEAEPPELLDYMANDSFISEDQREYDTFSMTLQFSVDDKPTMDAYIKAHGKDALVDACLKVVRGDA